MKEQDFDSWCHSQIEQTRKENEQIRNLIDEFQQRISEKEKELMENENKRNNARMD